MPDKISICKPFRDAARVFGVERGLDSAVYPAGTGDHGFRPCEVRFLRSSDQSAGGLRIIERRLEVLSAILIIRARWESFGACLTCKRLRLARSSRVFERI